ncbi:MAG: hypothetical protein K2X99_00320 [Gemmatimonadaceae bacterium]|nr:hypothetical protein [Gemmatimonadaceae bacterium]
MLPILVEGALFVTLLVALGALVFGALLQFTPLGVKLQQRANQRRIARAANTDCPIHGTFDERALVRLPGGDTVCPVCYQETMHGKPV